MSVDVNPKMAIIPIFGVKKTARPSDMPKTKYVESLEKRGVTASLRPGGILWLEPKGKITESIRSIVQANKEQIIAELEEASESRPAASTRIPIHANPTNYPARYGECANCRNLARLGDGEYIAGKMTWAFDCGCCGHPNAVTKTMREIDSPLDTEEADWED
jgi:hypothetical protein